MNSASRAPVTLSKRACRHNAARARTVRQRERKRPARQGLGVRAVALVQTATIVLAEKDATAIRAQQRVRFRPAVLAHEQRQVGYLRIVLPTQGLNALAFGGGDRNVIT